MLKPTWHGQSGIFAYGLPTINQARRVAWKSFKAMIPKEAITKINEAEMSIETEYGYVRSTLYVYGLDAPERAEGLQYDHIVIDEMSDEPAGVFEKSFLPTLLDRNGTAWLIGVPKSFGCGAEDFRRYCEMGSNPEEKDWSFYNWGSATVVGESGIEASRNVMDSRNFSEQLEAIWGTRGGAVFYAFDEVANVKPITVNPTLPLIIGSDFNVDPMAWIIGQIDGTVFNISSEIWLRDTNTEKTLDHLWNIFQNHQGGFIFIGDATAQSRKTSANLSDYAQILNDKRFDQYKPKTVKYATSNPPIADRLASCNAKLCNAKGVRSCFIDPSCTQLIKDLRTRAFKGGSKELGDKGDIGHISDAFGYPIHTIWPATALQPSTVIPEVFIRNLS